MITVRVLHVCPVTKAETIARVTAPSIAEAVSYFPGSVVSFPLNQDEYFTDSDTPVVEIISGNLRIDEELVS